MERTIITSTVLFAGVALVLMPQVHDAVVQANALYALSLRADLPADTAMAHSSMPAWYSPLSVIVGVVLLLLGSALAWRSVTAVARAGN